MKKPAPPLEKALSMAKSQHQDVIIAGGGFVGLTLGLALAEVGLDVTIIEKAPLTSLTASAHDGRASAIAFSSYRMLKQLGVWDLLAGAAPIRDIRISDGRTAAPASPFFLHFAASELVEARGRAPQDVSGRDEPAMGFIVANQDLRGALQARVTETPRLTLLATEEIVAQEESRAGVAVELASGKLLKTPLLVAAYGRESSLRKAFGIALTRWAYSQKALVSTIQHDYDHGGVAHEHFLPAGPLAFLPLPDDANGRHFSSIVWTESAARADHLQGLVPEAFAHELALHFGPSLGRLTLEGARWCYPLGAHLSHAFYRGRLVLVGDAAHGIHPIAGQGLNLGLRDVAALAECLIDQARVGQDLGAGPALARYARWRRFDTLALIAATDGLNRLFSNDAAILRLGRDLGLALVNQLPPARHFFMRRAMGLAAPLPKLLAGEALL